MAGRGADWIGPDPPRHPFVPSRAGMAELARRAGFRVERYWYHTSDWVLLLSEALARGLRIYDREDGRFTPGTSFTNLEVNEARERAFVLNQIEDGDRACFIVCGLV